MCVCVSPHFGSLSLSVSVCLCGVVCVSFQVFRVDLEQRGWWIVITVILLVIGVVRFFFLVIVISIH